MREAVEAATWAPNHHVRNRGISTCWGGRRSSVAWSCASRSSGRRKSEEAAQFKREQWSQKPGWLAVTCRRSEDELLQREDYAACAAAVQNFMLYLWKAGVGSKWTTGEITRDTRFFDIVGIDAGQGIRRRLAVVRLSESDARAEAQGTGRRPVAVAVAAVARQHRDHLQCQSRASCSGWCTMGPPQISGRARKITSITRPAQPMIRTALRRVPS